LKKLRIISATLRYMMASSSNGYYTAHGLPTNTLTALNRWSVADKKLPGKFILQLDAWH